VVFPLPGGPNTFVRSLIVRPTDHGGMFSHVCPFNIEAAVFLGLFVGHVVVLAQHVDNGLAAINEAADAFVAVPRKAVAEDGPVKAVYAQRVAVFRE